MSDWWVHRLYYADPLMLVAWIGWVIASIVLHELGHGFAAERQGDPTPRRLGHLTLNPAVHIPTFAWILFAFAGITWGVMPIDPGNFRHGRRSRALVAFAGPAVNIALALILMTALVLWIKYSTAQPGLHHGVITVLETGAFVNVLLAIFNLLPLPPLDGSAILATAFRPVERWLRDPRVLNGGFAILIIAGMLGGFGFMQFVGRWIIVTFVSWLAGVLP